MRYPSYSLWVSRYILQKQKAAEFAQYAASSASSARVDALRHPQLEESDVQ